ncbi:succinylglutamate-semialdehyde dehydrogenase [Sphingomonas sp. CGMCC 1.13654]|uniref:Succinylglutamate-semialdehyde dehydrogenase n=1 Tax=Sphingomonas chungangi TaxID=2683589 RepID=A0A838L2Z8_9SPHN|nr:succinylglutamate-semialdehyde dehydrogenase [Sphingomonas chungangi]MBA2933015.1 succinylglutamate-semialdehyde dehydrogenase [Sphingomonas chungangi]MVW56635.1 aldehyde dehydrogenase family protein [Sphingomonas chungangi]
MLISTEPATGAVIWEGPEGDVDEEVAAARTSWAEWAARPLTVRIETLRRVVNTIRTRADAFADLIARETGKPLWEARAEIEAVNARVDIAVNGYSERTASRKLEGQMSSRTALRHKPHGVLGVITPHDFPAQIANDLIVPALIAGNAVVLKPSEKTPATARMLAECFHGGGVPQGVLRVIVGGAETGKALAKHPGIDGLLFTGSSRVGLALHRQFAETPTKLLSLAMGGNNPIVVWDSPTIHAAAIIVIQSAFMSAGQRCTAARRLIVRDGEHEALLDEIARLIGRLVIAEPHSSPAPFMGPVIDNEAAEQLQEQWLDLILKGGRAITHLQRPIPGRPFLTPGVIDVTTVDKRADEELFGPILQVIRVPDFDAAIAEANATRYGLSAALISDKPALYERFWANIRAGMVNWNRPTNGVPANAPLTGLGLSGNHRPGAYYAADLCAYPVVSGEAEQARASIGIGLRDA